jgi:hypothetical protein
MTKSKDMIGKTGRIGVMFFDTKIRFVRTKGCGSRIATLTMVFKLDIEAQKHWRRLNGSALLPKVVTGVQFIDGEELQEQAGQRYIAQLLRRGSQVDTCKEPCVAEGFVSLAFSKREICEPTPK